VAVAGLSLRAMSLDQQKNFHRYHRVLSRAKCSSMEASRVLFGLLVEAFAPQGPLVVGIDETLERRKGKKISAKGIYRDIRLDPAIRTSSKPVACGGYVRRCLPRLRGPGESGLCRFCAPWPTPNATPENKVNDTSRSPNGPASFCC